MNITIRYKLHPDKDFCLNNPEKFNGKFVDEIDSYVGKVSFDGAEPSIEAKDFLERLLCDGIHVKPSCYYLLKKFCDIIDNLENFISNRNSFILIEPEIVEYSQFIGGNYEGTEFKVTIRRDEKTAKKIIASSEKGFMVFDDAGTSVSDYGAAEKWFPTYEEAAQYALDLVKKIGLFIQYMKVVYAELWYMREMNVFFTNLIVSPAEKSCSIGKITNLMMSIKRGVHQSESNLS